MNLKSTILGVVETQLRENDPKATKKAFERLTAKGYSKEEIKEMIAVVILEDIYEMLKHKKPFDEEKFAKKLSKLG